MKSESTVVSNSETDLQSSKVETINSLADRAPTLEELIAAPKIAVNVPPFEIIEESEVARDRPPKKSRKKSRESQSASESDSEFSEDEEDYGDVDSNVEEVFPCECRYDHGLEETSPNSQACGSHSNCINRDLFIECNAEDCPCREKCQNQRFQRRQYANVKVFETKGKGFGLFTLQDLKP